MHLDGGDGLLELGAEGTWCLKSLRHLEYKINKNHPRARGVVKLSWHFGSERTYGYAHSTSLLLD